MNSALISTLTSIPRSSSEVGSVCMSEGGRVGGWIQSSENEPNLKLRLSIIFPLFFRPVGQTYPISDRNVSKHGLWTRYTCLACVGEYEDLLSPPSPPPPPPPYPQLRGRKNYHHEMKLILRLNILL